MSSRRPFLDKRLGHGCAYCGGPEETHDHVPSKVFLEEPFPADLPTVNSCFQCNQSFSLDEEYLACLLECVLVGSADPNAILRNRVRRALQTKPLLTAAILALRHQSPDGVILWIPDGPRVHNIILKLARGHAAFELSDPILERPALLNVMPLLSMPEAVKGNFERAGSGKIRGWPEIGSRAFSRVVGEPQYDTQQGPWIEVQAGYYRYAVDFHGGVTVRMVIREYLGCQVNWNG